MPKSFYLETYGCTASRNDAEILSGLLKKAGYKQTNFENADLVVINTCGVKNATENRIVNRLESMRDKGKKIVISGCLPKINPERLKKAVPEFQAMIDPRSVDKIVKAAEGEPGKVLASNTPGQKPLMPSSRLNPAIGVVQVSEGCTSTCTFCATRFARGTIYSHPMGTISRGVEALLGQGCKEIWLTSQDMGAYGFDTGRSLPGLINTVCNIEGKFFVRIGMMNPRHVRKMLPELIASYKNEKVFKFLHIPVQSGNDEVLSAMNRAHRVGDFIKIVSEFRKAFPSTSISTDVICGFPGETERQFKDTTSAIEQTRPDIVNVSRFCARPGTAAAKMKQLPNRIIKQRTRRASLLARKISLENNRQWVGWRGGAIVDEQGRGCKIARNFCYKQILLKNREVLIGETVNIKIKGATQRDLNGEIT